VIPYATTTRTRRNVAALAAAGWRLFLTPEIQTHHGLPYALDNGAWGAYRRGVPWDGAAFSHLLSELGAGADFVVLPDVVGDGFGSLARSLAWLPAVRAVTPRMLLSVQDGVDVDDVAALLPDVFGLFVGGTTEWKLSTLPWWAAVARRHGKYLHVARVNTARRIRLCQMAGAHSFDGTSATRYAVTLPELDEARRQEGLWRTPAPS
jgi:hypothetical protein